MKPTWYVILSFKYKKREIRLENKVFGLITDDKRSLKDFNFLFGHEYYSNCLKELYYWNQAHTSDFNVACIVNIKWQPDLYFNTPFWVHQYKVEYIDRGKNMEEQQWLKISFLQKKGVLNMYLDSTGFFEINMRKKLHWKDQPISWLVNTFFPDSFRLYKALL